MNLTGRLGSEKRGGVRAEPDEKGGLLGFCVGTKCERFSMWV